MGKVLCIQIAQTEQERKPSETLGGKGNDLFKQNTVLCPQWWKWLVAMHYLNAKHVEATSNVLVRESDETKKKY